MIEPMTPDEFLEKMRHCAAGYDPERQHGDADDLLCELLEQLGYGEGVTVYRTITKWYA